MPTRYRSRQLHFWVSSSELAQVRAIAESLGLSTTEYVRYVLDIEVARHKNAMKQCSDDEREALVAKIRARLAAIDKRFVRETTKPT
jgi:hypothetical protein